MVKICQNCEHKNPDDAFWCEKCNSRIINIIVHEKPDFEIEEEPEIKDERSDYIFEDKLSKFSLGFSMFKIPIAIIFVAILLVAAYFFVSGIGQTGYIFDKFGGCPWDEDNLPWKNMDFTWVEQLTLDDIFDELTYSQELNDISEINEDYWFEGDTIKTNDGWTFSINKVQDFNYNAKVLGYQYYNKGASVYQPSEIISPIDLFLGFDDIINSPQSYNYRIVSYFYRGVYYQFTGDSGSNYFASHTTNTHIIPHSNSVLNTLKTVGLDDVVSMSGYYVNVYATNSNGASGSWTTDTEIGNSHCEVILLDSISVISSYS